MCIMRIAALLASYALLVPGLSLTLIHWEVKAFGFIVADESKSVIGLLSHLLRQNAVLAAILVILYAVLIPACKLLAHLAAHGCSSIGQRRTFRILTWIARWSTVDAFMVLFMVGAVSKLSFFGDVVVHVETGCLWFTAYCFVSTAVSIEKSYSIEEGSFASYKFTETQFGLLRGCFMSLLLIVFFISLLVGMVLPLLEIRLDEKVAGAGMSQTISIWEMLFDPTQREKTDAWWLSTTFGVFSVAVPSTEALRIWMRTVWPTANPAHVPLRCLQAFSMLDVACMAGLLSVIVTRSGVLHVQVSLKGGWFILLGSSSVLYAMRFLAPKAVGQPYEAVLDDDIELKCEENTSGREVAEVYGIESKAYV